MSKPLRIWTNAETAEMRRLFASGMTDKEIGKQMGRSRTSVMRKRHRICFSRPRPDGAPESGRPSTWTTQQIDTLRKMYRAGKSDDEIGAAIGKTVKAVSSRRQKLGIVGRKPLPRKPRRVLLEIKRAHECPLTLKSNDDKARASIAAALERGEGVEGAMLAVMQLRGLAA